MSRPPLSRRRLLEILASSLPAAALCRTALGAGSGKLDPKDPAAMALGYVEQAAQADVKKFPSYVPGSTCENCLQLQGTPGAGYRPCATFKGKLVAVGGWCSAWTAEM